MTTETCGSSTMTTATPNISMRMRWVESAFLFLYLMLMLFCVGFHTTSGSSIIVGSNGHSVLVRGVSWKGAQQAPPLSCVDRMVLVDDIGRNFPWLYFGIAKITCAPNEFSKMRPSFCAIILSEATKGVADRTTMMKEEDTLKVVSRQAPPGFWCTSLGAISCHRQEVFSIVP